MLPLPSAPPGPGAAAETGDIKVLMVDALRGMIQAAADNGIDFDEVLQEAQSASAAGPPASPSGPSSGPPPAVDLPPSLPAL